MNEATLLLLNMGQGALQSTVQNVALYSLQVALIVGIGILLPSLFRLHSARARLHYWYALLLVALLLPWLPTPSADAVGLGVAPPVVIWIEELVAVGDARSTTETTLSASLLLWSWGLGAAARGAWLLLGGLHLRSLRQRGHAFSPSIPPSLEARLESELERTRFVISGAISTPFTYGWRHPTVILPRHFCALSDQAREAVLTHELVHVARRDWLASLFEEAVLLVLWFHPALWMLTGRICLTREQVVDLEAVAITSKRREYMEALIEMARPRRQELLSPVIPLLRNSDLKRRITTLLEETPMSKTRLIASLCAITLLLTAATAVAARAFPVGFPGTSQESNAPASEDVAEPIFVEGDVQKPVKIYSPAPEYPEEAKKNKLQGAVITQAVIDQHGDVIQLTVLEGDELLAKAAVAAIETWRFEPATLDGEAVSVYFNLTVTFRLE